MEQRRRNFREFDDIYRKYGKRFRFPVYLGEDFLETPLENLELSVRSYNCLWRAGIRNVGNIVNRIDNRTDLLHIRNLGIRSADEIMTAAIAGPASVRMRRGSNDLWGSLSPGVEKRDKTTSGVVC